MAEARPDPKQEDATVEGDPSNAEAALTTIINHAVGKGGGAVADAVLQARATTDIVDKLSAAPAAIGTLGRLAILSAGGTDFTLVVNPEEKFKRLKFPTSYRASLTQVRTRT